MTGVHNNKKANVGILGNPLNKESLTKQISDDLKQKHTHEIEALREEFEKEREMFEKDKEDQEKMLRDMFHTEMDSLKSRLENDFAKAKSVIIKEFHDRFKTERQQLERDHQRQLDHREQEMKTEMANLRLEIESQKKRLEEDLKAQFAADIAHLRNELERGPVKKSSSSDEVKNDEKVTESGKKMTRKTTKCSPFLKELQGLEDDIRQLRSAVKMEPRLDSDLDSLSTISDDHDQPNFVSPFSMERRFAPQTAMQVEQRPFESSPEGINIKSKN